jgi:hypothetical protein
MNRTRVQSFAVPSIDRQSWLRADSQFEVGVPPNNQLRPNVFLGNFWALTSFGL